jgi:hypothetical protein
MGLTNWGEPRFLRENNMAKPLIIANGLVRQLPSTEPLQVGSWNLPVGTAPANSFFVCNTLNTPAWIGSNPNQYLGTGGGGNIGSFNNPDTFTWYNPPFTPAVLEATTPGSDPQWATPPWSYTDIGTPTADNQVLNSTAAGAATWTASPELEALTVDNILIDANSITSDTGTVDFGNDHITTTTSLTANRVEVGDLTLVANTISAASGLISFVDDNIITTGDITAGLLIGDELLVDNITIDANTITSDTATVNFVNDKITTTGDIVGGRLTVDNLQLNNNAITSDTGTVNFVDDHIITTGDITGNIVSAQDKLVVDNITIDGNTITSDTGTINFVDENLTTTGDLTVTNIALNADGHITNVCHIDFDLTHTTGHQEGRMHWNNDDGTVAIGMPGGAVELQVGQELLLRARNVSGAGIGNGTPVYISGAQANRPTIEAGNNSSIYTAGIIALTTEAIADVSNGYCTTAGLVRDVDTSAWAEGTLLWLDDTDGGLVGTMPQAPNSRVALGYVLRQHATEGIILTKPTIIPNMMNISGVNNSVAPTDGQALVFDGSDSSWHPRNTQYDFWNGTFRETFDATVSSADGITITLSLEKSGGGDLTMQFSDGETVLDCTPAQTTTLTPGTDTSPAGTMVYITKATKTLGSGSVWPSEEHIRVAYFALPSASFVQTYGGPYINQNWNDHLSGTDLQGHLAHVCAKLRSLGANWYSGINPNGATSSYFTIAAGSVYWLSTSGVIAQLHNQNFGAKDTSGTNVILVKNDNTTPFVPVQNLYTGITADSTGTTITNNRYFSIVFWGVQNKTDQGSGVICNLPGGTYTSSAGAINDAQGYDDYTFPREFDVDSSTAFLICRATFQKTVSGWTWIQTEDLRGKSPSKVAGGGAGASDHGALGGLLDDDHTQYVLADGTRAFTGTVGGVTPTVDAHLATKGYTDGYADGVMTTHESTYNHTNYDTAYGWGDHAGLYDTTGTAAAAVSTHESTYNHANYDTAYGWGDHAGLYYATGDFITTSAGAGDAGKPIVLNGSGLVDSTMLPAGIGTPSAAGEIYQGTGAGTGAWTTDITGLTSLVVDNLTLDGNSISSDNGIVSIPQRTHIGTAPSNLIVGLSQNQSLSGTGLANAHQIQGSYGSTDSHVYLSRIVAYANPAGGYQARGQSIELSIGTGVANAVAYAIGSFIGTFTTSGTGNVQKAMSLYVQAQTVGTVENWSIYVYSGDSYFGGDTYFDKNVKLLSDSAANYIQVARFGAHSYAAQWLSTKGRGTVDVPTATISADTIARFSANGYDNVGVTPTSNESDYMTVNATETWTSTGHGRDLRFYYTAIGSTSYAEGFRLNDSGVTFYVDVNMGKLVIDEITIDGSTITKADSANSLNLTSYVSSTGTDQGLSIFTDVSATRPYGILNTFNLETTSNDQVRGRQTEVNPTASGAITWVIGEYMYLGGVSGGGSCSTAAAYYIPEIASGGAEYSVYAFNSMAIATDNRGLFLGTGKDALIYFDGTNLILDPQYTAGSGATRFPGSDTILDAGSRHYIGQHYIGEEGTNRLQFTSDRSDGGGGIFDFMCTDGVMDGTDYNMLYVWANTSTSTFFQYGYQSSGTNRYTMNIVDGTGADLPFWVEYDSIPVTMHGKFDSVYNYFRIADNTELQLDKGNVFEVRPSISYQWSGTQTGTMKIRQGWATSNVMDHTVIRGYNYIDTPHEGPWEIRFGGYDYTSGPQWIAQGCSVIGNPPFQSVRCGFESGYPVILLGLDGQTTGETATSWNYPWVSIESVTAPDAYGGGDIVDANAWTFDISNDEATDWPSITGIEDCRMSIGPGCTIEDQGDGSVKLLVNSLEITNPESGNTPTITGGDWDIYVAADGNDTTGDGTSGNEYASVARALLDCYKLVPSGSDKDLDYTITIHVEAGHYTVGNAIRPNYAYGANLVVEGAVQDCNASSATSYGSDTALSSGLSYVNVSGVLAAGTTATIGDYLVVKAATGGTNPHLVEGVHEITAWNSGTRAYTAKVIRRSGVSALPSGTITLTTAYVAKTVFNHASGGGIKVTGAFFGGTWNKICLVGNITSSGVWCLNGGKISIGSYFATSKWKNNVYAQNQSMIFADYSAHSYSDAALVKLQNGSVVNLRYGVVLTGSRSYGIQCFIGSTVAAYQIRMSTAGGTTAISCYQGAYVEATSSILKDFYSTCEYGNAFRGGGIDFTSSTQSGGATSTTADNGYITGP